MKKTTTIYWISTSLFAAFMLFSAIPDVISSPEAMDFITKLGYPRYFVPFIGVLKVLGVIAILIPGYPRIKEWAYAGLAFDLLGAIYSLLAIGTPATNMLPMLVPVLLGLTSYVFHHRKAKERSLSLSPGMAY